MPQSWWKLLIGWRVALCVLAVAVTMIGEPIAQSEFAFLSFHQPRLASHLPGWLAVWANFDGVYFLANSLHPMHEPRYLPLYPVLIQILGGSWLSNKLSVLQYLVALIVSNGALVGAVIGLRKLLKEDYEEQTVFWMVVFLLLFPTGFFLSAVYSESIFLLLSVMVLLTARRRRWWVAGVCVGLASVTRLPGILLLIPVAWEWWSSRKAAASATQLRSIFVGLIGAFLPLVLYALVNQQLFNDALYFIHAHGTLGNGRSTTGLIFPGVTVWRYAKMFSTVSIQTTSWWVAAFEVTSVAWVAVGSYLGWRRHIRGSYLWYIVAVCMMPLLSGTFSGFPRYALLAWPVMLFAAQLAPRWRWVLLGVCVVLQIAVMSAFFLGVYVS